MKNKSFILIFLIILMPYLSLCVKLTCVDGAHIDIHPDIASYSKTLAQHFKPKSWPKNNTILLSEISNKEELKTLKKTLDFAATCRYLETTQSMDIDEADLIYQSRCNTLLTNNDYLALAGIEYFFNIPALNRALSPERCTQALCLFFDCEIKNILNDKLIQEKIECDNSLTTLQKHGALMMINNIGLQ